MACGLRDGVLAALDRDRTEVLGGRAVDVLVAPAPHGEPLRRGEVAVRHGELPVAAGAHQPTAGRAVAGVRAEHAEHDGHVGLAGHHRRRRPGDRRGHGVAAAHDAGVPAEVVDADGVGDVHRLRRRRRSSSR